MQAFLSASSVTRVSNLFYLFIVHFFGLFSCLILWVFLWVNLLLSFSFILFEQASRLYWPISLLRSLSRLLMSFCCIWLHEWIVTRDLVPAAPFCPVMSCSFLFYDPDDDDESDQMHLYWTCCFLLVHQCVLPSLIIMMAIRIDWLNKHTKGRKKSLENDSKNTTSISLKHFYQKMTAKVHSHPVLSLFFVSSSSSYLSVYSLENMSPPAAPVFCPPFPSFLS